MYYTLEEVRVGLANGHSFVRNLGSTIFDGKEYVRSLFDGYKFEHIVIGKSYGGVAELNISTMTTEDRWATDGWRLVTE